MPTTRTYHVGDQGICRRLDNLSGSWTNLTINVGALPVTSVLLDVETDPNNGDKVIAVGRGFVANNHYGIYVSNDAGVTWTQPIGNYSTNLFSGNLLWYEVFYLDSNTIFVSGELGYIAISTDGGLTFNLATQIPPVPTCLICPAILNKVYSVHFISPTQGVVGLQAAVSTTTDGGVTWTSSGVISALPVGEPVNITGIHMSQTGLVINALSSTGMFRSADGGVTWANTFTFINRVGLHLTWINDNELWAFCKENLIIKSVDAGLTWTIVRAQSAGPQQHEAGHFYQNQNGFFSTNNILGFTTDGATTDVLYDSVPADQKIRAVWTWLATPTCYKMTPCDEANPIFYVSNDFSSIVDQVINICPENIPSNVVNAPTGQAFSIPYNPNNITLFKLVDCCQSRPDIYLANYNLTTYQLNGGVIQIDQIPGACWSVQKADSEQPIYLINTTITGVSYANCPSCVADFACSTPTPYLPECACYTVETTDACSDVITLVNISAPETFNTCEICTNIIQPPCYLLTDCADSNYTITTGDDLSEYVGLVVNIRACEGCFTVSITEDCAGAVSVLPVTASFETCIECNPPVEPEPFRLITRKVEPGYSTQVCPPEYVEKVNCTFSEAMYNEVLSKRYGLENCCVIDAQKWTIKKELMDLKMLELPSPSKPDCYCYTISQSAGTNCFKYIDCTGCLQTVTLNTGESALVCAMYKPSVVCPANNQNFSITKSDKVCTDNQSCVTCYCVELFQNSSKEPIPVTYTSCSGASVTVNVESNVSVYICTNPITLVLPALVDGYISTTECSSDADCQPPVVTCYCYNINFLGFTSFAAYTACDGSSQTISGLIGSANVCARPNSISGQNIEVSGGDVSCTSDNDCQLVITCYCYIITPLTMNAEVTYTTCDGVIITSGASAGTMNICAREGSVSGTDITIYQSPTNCTIDADCQT